MEPLKYALSFIDFCLLGLKLKCLFVIKKYSRTVRNLYAKVLHGKRLELPISIALNDLSLSFLDQLRFIL